MKQEKQLFEIRTVKRLFQNNLKLRKHIYYFGGFFLSYIHFKTLPYPIEQLWIRIKEITKLCLLIVASKYEKPSP